MRLGVFSLIVLSLWLTGCAVNPVTGKKGVNFVSTQEQIAMGEKNYNAYQQQQGGQYAVDPGLNRYIRNVGMKLAAVSDQPNLPYDFVVINDDTPNAWALPGGKIAINRGLLTLLDDESQLAAVLGHEIVHAAAGHSAQQQSRATLMGLGAALLTLAVSDSDYSPLIGAGVGLGVGMAVAKYGRDQELESDRYGIQYMAKAGYTVEGAVELQEKFVALSQGRDGGSFNKLFASHPPSQERVTKNRQALAQFPGGTRNKAQFQAAIGQLKRDADAYRQHAKAREAAAAKRYSEALSLTENAIRQQPREALFHITQGQLLMMQEQPSAASRAFKRATQENPDYVMGFLYHGMSEKKLGNYPAANRSLERSLQILPTALGAYHLGDLAKLEGDRPRARQYFRMAAQDQTAVGQAARAQLQQLGE
jgi:beta-barrel assembly-enhancing protease